MFVCHIGDIVTVSEADCIDYVTALGNQVFGCFFTFLSLRYIFDIHSLDAFSLQSQTAQIMRIGIAFCADRASINETDLNCVLGQRRKA